MVRAKVNYVGKIYKLQDEFFVLIHRENYKNDFDYFRLDVEIKLKEKKFIDFIIENIVIYVQDNQISYVALYNIDRLSNPGEIVSEFYLKGHDRDYIVRALFYRQTPATPFAITCHRVEDITDRDKI